jgi:spermidine synthase
MNSSLRLGIIVFLTGAVVMILEIVGSRILAPYLGTSIFVWTSLIGIILGSLSFGYYKGGKIADSDPNYRTFSLIILSAALFLGITTVLQGVVLNLIENSLSDIRMGAILSALILFAPTSALLGMVSPYAARLAIKSLEASGSTVGTLYAISTAGSILGTFVAGFFLISFFGSIQILRILAVILFATAILAYPGGIKQIVIPVVVCVSLLWGMKNLFGSTIQSGVVDADTMYNRIWIFDSVDKATQMPIKIMKTDNMPSSAIFLNSDELVFAYTRFYDLVECFHSDPVQGLVIGGGAYSFPRHFLKKFPDSHLDVVELDPGQTLLAKKFFHLKEDRRLAIYHEDGRTFLNRIRKKYDAIFMDAFKSLYSIPPHLTTREAVLKMYNLLNDDGILLANIISSIDGKTGRFARAEYRTYKQVFPQVMLYPVQHPEDPQKSQNIILIALKKPAVRNVRCNDPVLAEYLKHRWTLEVPEDVPILTDDYAPVDRYAASVIEAIGQ